MLGGFCTIIYALLSIQTCCVLGDVVWDPKQSRQMSNQGFEALSELVISAQDQVYNNTVIIAMASVAVTLMTLFVIYTKWKASRNAKNLDACKESLLNPGDLEAIKDQVNLGESQNRAVQDAKPTSFIEPSCQASPIEGYTVEEVQDFYLTRNPAKEDLHSDSGLSTGRDSSAPFTPGFAGFNMPNPKAPRVNPPGFKNQAPVVRTMVGNPPMVSRGRSMVGDPPPMVISSRSQFTSPPPGYRSPVSAQLSPKTVVGGRPFAPSPGQPVSFQSRPGTIVRSASGLAPQGTATNTMARVTSFKAQLPTTTRP